MELVNKLKKFVSEHPEAADAPTVNMNTGRETTIRGILEELMREQETGIAIVDPEILEVKSNIERWLEEV